MAVATGLMLPLWRSGHSVYVAKPMFFWVLSDYGWLFIAVLVSGIAAAAGLWMLVPPLLAKLGTRWLKRAVGIAVWLLFGAAALVWLVNFLMLLVLAVGAQHARVVAENGQSVLVSEGPMLDPYRYSVLGEVSKHHYSWVADFEYEDAPMDTSKCTLVPVDAGLLLTCGDRSVQLPAR